MFLVYKLYTDFYERLANRQSINETIGCLYRFGNGAARWMCGRVSATTVVSEIMCVPFCHEGSEMLVDAVPREQSYEGYSLLSI